MTGPIFDTHAHYSARAFDADRDFLLGSLPGKGVVGVCEQATHSGDAPKVLELAHRYPWVVAAVGIHPESLLPAADCGDQLSRPQQQKFFEITILMLHPTSPPRSIDRQSVGNVLKKKGTCLFLSLT